MQLPKRVSNQRKMTAAEKKYLTKCVLLWILGLSFPMIVLGCYVMPDEGGGNAFGWGVFLVAVVLWKAPRPETLDEKEDE